MRPLVRLGLAAVLLLVSALPARAVELTAFLSSASPGENWKRGVGATLTTTWFRVVALEAELANQPFEPGEGGLTTFTGTALLAPPVGRLVPFAGLGVGAFRRTVLGDTDTSSHSCLVAGLKLKLGLLVLRGEYRKFDLDDPAGRLDSRVSLGAGVSF